MPGFWGMSGQGNDARNNLDQLADILRQYGVNMTDAAGGQKGLADALQSWYNQRILNAEDFGDPDFIHGIGGQVLPGVDGMIQRRQQRAADYASRVGNLPTAQDLFGIDSDILDQYGSSISGNRDNIASLINDTFGRISARGDRAHRDIVGSIGDSYRAAEHNQRNIINDILSSSDRGFAGMRGDLDAGYGDSRSVIDRYLNPNSGATAARVGRSFAPSLASTASRLRRMGVQDNSFEGNAALREVESDRARAMDDASSDDARAYAGAVTGLNRDKIAQILGLGTAKLNLDTGVKQAWGNRVGQLALGQGQDFRDALREDRDISRGLDLGRMGANQANENDAMTRATDYYSRRQDAANRFRGNSYQDLAAFMSANDAGNTADDYELNTTLQRYMAGRQQRNDVLGRRDFNTGRVGNQMNDSYSRYLQMFGAGTNALNTAAGQYGNIYGREADTGGWGARLLAGLGGSLAGAYMGRTGGRN